MRIVAEDPQSEIEHLLRENEALKKKLEKFETSTPSHSPEQLSIPSFGLDSSPISQSNHSSGVTSQSTTQEQIALFRSLFRGREDAYAERFESEYTGKKGYMPACQNKWDVIKKGAPKILLPLTDQVIHDHLMTDKTIGVYPLLPNNTCYFLACDFDKGGWQLDAVAYLAVCRQYGIPAYLERSRSGNGGHVWIFFAGPVPAMTARKLGMGLLRQTMEMRGEMDLGSYDRFFPNQDFTPNGGFGNLIALPFQKKPREQGNSLFLDVDASDLKPWPDQWVFLSGVKRISSVQLDGFLQKVPSMTVGVGTMRPPSQAVRQKHPAPAQIRCTLGAMFSIERSGIPPWLLSQLKHLGSLWNPEFFKKQKLRYSTYGTPPLLKCYSEDMSHLHLPRGTLEEIESVVKEAGSELVIVDQRPVAENIPLQFHGKLTDIQETAMRSVLSNELGILVAPPGAGKTVMGCYAIAQRSVPTLVLSHRKPILDQWRAQLMTLLKLTSAEIGQVGGGRNRQSGIVDLGMLQSLDKFEPADLEDFFSKYDFVVVDECHHLPAITFETSMKKCAARYILGLTATPKRNDQLDDIIPMQCGPIRYRMVTEDNGIPRHLIVRHTELQPPPAELNIQAVFKAMSENEGRNRLIQDDIGTALKEGRRCLILSRFKEHCRVLADGMTRRGKAPFLLTGDLGKKERIATIAQIQAMPPDKELIIIATSQYLGEGFDCPQVDTLFLTFPVKFRGKLVQQVGRILRSHEGKKNARVYDYLDKQVPVLNQMYYERARTYKTMRFTPEN